MKLFTSTGLHTVKFRSGSEKTVVVRFPNDKEWAEKAAGIKLVRHDLGRDKAAPNVVGAEEAYSKLYAAVKTEESMELDGHDARTVLSRFEDVRLVNIEFAGDHFTVEMEARGATVKHRLRCPTRQQIEDCSKVKSPLISIRRGIELKTYWEPAGSLYDILHVSHEGYQGPVPLPHKAHVIDEIDSELNRLNSDEDPE